MKKIIQRNVLNQWITLTIKLLYHIKTKESHHIVTFPGNTEWPEKKVFWK